MKRKKPYLLAGLVLLLFLLCTACGNAEGQIAPQDDPNEGLGGGFNEDTVKDVVENPHNVKIQELEAAQVSRVKDEVAFVVLNGNYALQAGFSVAHDAVAYETSASAAAKTYANVLAVKAGNENNEGVQALVKVLKSDEIKKFINDTYDGAVIPFED